jgi:hypothetical protein
MENGTRKAGVPQRWGGCRALFHYGIKASSDGEELAGVIEAGGAFGVAAEHASELPDPVMTVQALERGSAGTAAVILDDEEVVVSAGSDLWEVGDGENLVVLGHVLELGPDPNGNPSTDARVDLIEDEGGHGIDASQDGLEGEHDAGELAAGGDPGEGAGFEAAVHCHQELDALAAVGAGLGESLEIHPEPGAVEAESGEHVHDLPGEPVRGA